MDISKVKATVTTIEAGLWIDNIPEMGDLRLRVRPAISPSIAALRTKLARNVAPTERDDRGDLLFEVSERISVDLLVGAVLVGWDNVTAAGEIIPYTPEKAEEILRNPDFRVFRLAVEWAATVASYQAFDYQSATLGNSEAPSAGA